MTLRRTVTLAAALVAPLAHLSLEADNSLADSRVAAAFARYVAQRRSAALWSLESIDIEASLPRLAKHATFRAIRRIPPDGDPKYEEVETYGDRMVTREVIARYLSAEARATGLPASSVAMTPANYKFSYKGLVPSADSLVYAFAVTPRKKALGLIRGELWLDDSGMPVRESGYLVRQPSIFVKRVQVMRNLSVRNGVAVERLTRLLVDTRALGRAELAIDERPYGSIPGPAAPLKDGGPLR